LEGEINSNFLGVELLTLLKKTEPTFEICIKSTDEDLAVTLHVVFVATYPKSQPLLSLKNDDGLREGTKFKLQKVIETLPKQLLAEEQAMIMEVVDALREVLEDAAGAVAAGRELPSLEEERVTHEAAAARLAKEHEVEEEKKRQDETKEQERQMEHMLQEQLKRQRAQEKEAKRKTRPPAMNKELSLEVVSEESKDRLIFDQPIILK
jgi:translation initiation factor 2-alpha kinase 4